MTFGRTTGRPRASLRTLACLAALLVPGLASAGGKVVVTPLLADDSVNAKQRLGVHQLIASELEFSPEVEGVVDLDAAPATLDDACLANPRCLGTIATQNEAQTVISGRMSGQGSNYVLDLLFFDGRQVARRKQYTVPQDPTDLANQITPIVRELLTGEVPGGAKPAASASFDPDEELAIGGGAAVADLLDEEPIPMPAPAPARAAPPPPPMPAPVAAAPAGSDARRLAAAGAATGLVTSAPPPAPPPPPAPTDADLASMISFGGSVNDISAEEIDSMIKFGPPPGVASPAPAPMPAPAPVAVAPAPAPRGAADPSLAEEEAELASLDGGGIADLDEEEPRKTGKTAAPSSTRSSTTVERGEMNHRVQFTGRGGYSRYYSFGFITGGGELGVHAAKGVHFVAGVETYAVNRILPPELQIQTGLYSEWNFIFPMNVGILYKFPLGIAQPYVGADVIFVQYYRDAIGADWAGGGRARAGVDVMFVPNFGLNVNLAAGGWSGKNWGLIQQGVRPAGFLPQVSGGAVVAF